MYIIGREELNMKLKLVVADSDKEYLEHFSKCVQSNYFDDIELATFSGQDTLDEYLDREECNVLLYDRGFETKEFHGVKFQLSAEPGLDEKDGVPVICKYQKLEKIYKKALGAYAETKESYRLSALKEKDGTKVVSFLSASGGAGKTVCAITYARLQALKNKRVLYLSSETLSTLGAYFPDQGDVNMSQIFFAVKRSKGNIPMKIQSALHVDQQGVYYFLPGDNPMEMLEITEEDWKELLIQLISMKLFDLIVIDIENPLQPAMGGILTMSDVLMTVTVGYDQEIERCRKLFKTMRVVEKQLGENWMEKMYCLINRRNGRYQSEEVAGVRVIGEILPVEREYAGRELVDYILENNMIVGLQ